MLWNKEENLGWCPQVPNTRLTDNIMLIFVVLCISLKWGRREYLWRYEHSSRFPGSPGRIAYVPPAWSIFFRHVRGVQTWMCNATGLSGGVWEGGGFVFRHKRHCSVVEFPFLVHTGACVRVWVNKQVVWAFKELGLESERKRWANVHPVPHSIPSARWGRKVVLLCCR